MIVEIVETKPERWGGLTHDEWIHVAQVIMRWPRLGVCDSSTSQALVAGINERLKRACLMEDERDA